VSVAGQAVHIADTFWYCFAAVFFRSKAATIGAFSYWLVFVCASVYPEFDSRTFAGLPALMLARPWVDCLPNSGGGLLIAGCALLNTFLIYIFISAALFVWGRLRKRKV
jgi:hypothetical protein